MSFQYRKLQQSSSFENRPEQGQNSNQKYGISNAAIQESMLANQGSAEADKLSNSKLRVQKNRLKGAIHTAQAVAYIKTWVKQQLPDIKLGRPADAGGLEVLPEKEFVQAYRKVILEMDPRLKDMIDAYYPEEKLNGFEHNGTAYIRASRVNIGTCIHEMLHTYSHENWKEIGGKAAEEGATELFTRLCLRLLGPSITRNYYPAEYAALQSLTNRLGVYCVARFYFEGDRSLLDQYAATVVKERKNHSGNKEQVRGDQLLEEWFALMKKGNASMAATLF